MALAALQSNVLTSANDGQSRDTGFELGWDYAHHGLVPPAAHLHPLSSVRQGWEAGRTTFGHRTLQSNRFVRKWLQLRLGAWLRGRAFEGTQVNPTFSSVGQATDGAARRWRA